MIELFATTVITASSVLLFGYWFRYTCLLILSARTTKDHSGEIVVVNQLSFPEVQSRLRKEDAELDSLQKALDRDYATIRHLLRRVSSEGVLERRMLELNYRVMRFWYRASRQFSTEAARHALTEMALLVAHFANAVGECSAA